MPNRSTPDRIDLSRATIGDNQLIIQLIRERGLTPVERQPRPAMVALVWPATVTITPASTYGDVAAQLARTFASSAVALAAFKKQHRYL